MSDELVLKLKKHDKKAFESLVLSYEKKIYNYAYGFTLSHDDALDITQEVFLKIYRNIDKFKEESSISTWIYRITSNACIDFSRKNKNIHTININDENFDLIENIEDTKASPEKEAIDREMSVEVLDYLNKLDENSREIIIMRDMLELSYDEISKILDINEGTVKSRISRSRKKLRDLIISERNFC